MPYIDPHRKWALEPDCVIAEPLPENPGELNYLFTRILVKYWQVHGRYQGINDIVGALEGAKLEFYRRVAVPYEDAKRQENGDVYP